MMFLKDSNSLLEPLLQSFEKAFASDFWSFAFKNFSKLDEQCFEVAAGELHNAFRILATFGKFRSRVVDFRKGRIVLLPPFE